MLCNHNAIKVYKSIAVFMATLIICLSIFAYKPIHKPKASVGLSMLACAGITGLIYGGTSVAGYTSGALNIEYAKLEAIQTFVTPLLEAAGNNAIERANRLGEAIASGAEASVIQGLATGTVIYAFGQAISNVLFPSVSDSYVVGSGLQSYIDTCQYTSSTVVNGVKVSVYSNRPGIQAPLAFNVFNANYRVCFPAPYSSGNNNNGTNGAIVFDYGSLSTGLYLSFASANKDGNPYNYPVLYTGYIKSALASVLLGGIGYNDVVSNLNQQEQIGILTSKLDALTGAINAWDGSSDLVISPPIGATSEDVFRVGEDYTGTAEEEGIRVPWLEAILTAIGVPDTNIASVIEGVEATIGEIAENTGEIAGTISGTLTGVDSAIRDYVASIDDFFALPEDIAIFDDAMAVLNDKFRIIPQLNNALGRLDVATRPLIIYYPYLDGTTKEINLNWYEPMRGQVKSGVAVVFEVMTAMACFAIVSNVFGIGIRVGTKETVTDKPSEGRK